MSQVIVAVTDIKHDDIKIKSGDPVPVDKFTKDQLIALYEVGAITKVDALPAKDADKAITDADLANAGTDKAEVDEDGKLIPRKPKTETETETPVEPPKTPEPVVSTPEPQKPTASATTTKASATTAKPASEASTDSK